MSIRRLCPAILCALNVLAAAGWPNRAIGGGFGGMQFQTFSFDPLSPEQGPPAAYSASDIILGGLLPPAPAWRPFGAFGLLQADDIDAITFGGAGCVTCPPADNFYQTVFFSVAPGSTGLAGLGDAILFENGVDGAAGDIFAQRNNDGLKGRVALACNAGFRFGVGCVLGLTNGPALPNSNVDAWSGGGPAGALAVMPLLFSLGPATAAGLGVSPADILLNDPAVIPAGIAIPFFALGLVANDDVDALDASTRNVRQPQNGDWIYFSLRAGSPTLAAMGASPADILVYVLGSGAPLPAIWSPAAAHGMRPLDDLDALDIWDPGFPTLTGDGGYLEAHAGHRCSWPVPIDETPLPRSEEPVVAAGRQSIPSPANCTVDDCLRSCPGGDVLFQVIVRDLANNRISGSVVELNFTNCPGFEPCPTGNAYTLDWPNRSIRLATDFAGVASFPLRGGGFCSSASVEVRADGVLIATRSLTSPDLNADLMVDGVDRVLLSALDGSSGPEGDFDCSGAVSGAFDPENPPPPPPPLGAPPVGRHPAALLARVASNPVRAGALATLLVESRSAGSLTAELVDLSGRRHARWSYHVDAAGPSSHAWRVPGDVPMGVYLLRLRLGSESAAIKVILLGR